ncbi:hypothetical protein [Mycolicibacterium brisbanense]
MSIFTTEQRVQNLIRNVQDAAWHREAARDYLRMTLQTDSWRDYRTPNGVRVEHTRFTEFVGRLHPFGMSTVTHTVTVDELRDIAASDPELLALLDRELAEEKETAA